jgi:hypothetical protein
LAGILAEHPILGTFEVICNGASLRLGLSNQRVCTAISPPNASQIVSTDRRIGLLSGDRAPGKDRVVAARVDAHCSNGGISGDYQRARARGPGCG